MRLLYKIRPTAVADFQYGSLNSKMSRIFSSLENEDKKRKLPKPKPFEEIPHLRIFPVVGSAWAYYPIIGRYNVRRNHLNLQDKYEMFGNILREKLGSADLVTIFHPNDILTIQRMEGRTPFRGELETLKLYRNSKIAQKYYKNAGLLVMQGEDWYRLRIKVGKRIMSPRSVILYIDPIYDVAKEFVQKMSETRDAKNEIPNFMDELSTWALESIAAVSLDKRLGCLQKNLPKDSDAVRMIKSVKMQLSLMPELESFGGNVFQLWKKFRTPKWRKFENAATEFTVLSHKYISQAVEKIQKQPEKPKKTSSSLLELLLAHGADESELFATAVDLLMGGIDTTSNGIGYVLYHLSRHPDKQEKLYQEIATLLPTKDHRVTVDNYEDFEYARSCIKETLRLNPVNLALARKLDIDVVLSGYLVPAGTWVAIGIYPLHRDPKYFVDALSYIPERFVDRWQEDLRFVYRPFGVGARSCVGQRIAEEEMRCLLIEIIRRFRVEYHYEDMGMISRISTTPDKPLRFTFLDR